MNTPFRPAIASALIPSAIPGAFLSPEPPSDFDPNTSDVATLAKHAFHWHRPDPDADPALAAAWNSHFGDGFSVGTWLRPEQEPLPDRRHIPRKRLVGGTTQEEITNWGGGVVRGSFTSCAGTWNVPTVSKPTEAAGPDGGWNSSSWVGLDGQGSDDVLQAGVEHDVDARGNTDYFAWYEWYCRVGKTTLNELSGSRPALAALNGNIYIAWSGTGNNQLNVAVSTDRGVSFGQKLVSGETSPTSPSLCVHQGKLFIAWIGSGNNQPNVAEVSLNGRAFPTAIAGKTTLGNDISPGTPSLCSFNNNLYLSWIGKDNDQLNLSVSTDGARSFGQKHISAETSPRTPALIAFSGRLLIAWTGSGNDQLNVAQAQFNGAAVTAIVSKSVLGDTSPLPPSLAVVGSVLYMAWRSNGSDSMNIFKSTDGASWSGKLVEQSETSPDGPVLTGRGNDLFIGWRGDGNENLNVAVVGIVNNTITGFSTPAYRNSVRIPNFAVKPGDKVSCSVSYLADRSGGTVTFSNTTTNVKFPITLTPPPGADMTGQSGEWVVEVPTIDNTYSHLPVFSTVNFTQATACGSSGAANTQTATIATIKDDSNNGLTTTALAAAAITVSYVAPPKG